jgi:ribosomal protein S18 acetylase RimI-like enzyme
LAIKELLNIIGNKKIDLVVHPKNTSAIITYLKSWFEINWWKKNLFWDWEDRLYLIKN